MNKGYHQLSLHRSSRYITTFVTHKGLFRYRLHFGINTAAEIFQHEIAKLLHGLPNTINISDDILIFGINKEQHDKALADTLNVLQNAGVTLNKNKCLFGKSTLKFLGHIFSSEGVSTDPAKIAAICELDRPNNATEVRSLLGMVNFSSKFLPHLAIIAKPLRDLTKHNQYWFWSNEHQLAFDKIKTTLSQATKLTYFDKSLKTEICTDASPLGIGALLLQRNDNGEKKIIAFASHAFSDIEKRYSQIEREALALIWATSHFHLYIYGNEFKLITDHKPLLTLFQDCKNQLSSRLERWRIKLQPYNYTIDYVPGKRNPADYMSRHPMNGNTKPLLVEHIAEEYVNFNIQQSVPKMLTVEEIKFHTKNDEILQGVLHSLLDGSWTKKLSTIYKEQWQPHYKTKHELSTNSDANIILRGSRIVLPKQLQTKVINIAHSGHQGISKTKSLLKEKVWFPGLERKVEQIVSKCLPCSAVTPEQGISPLNPSPFPDKPWTYLNIDHKGPLPTGEYLLVVIDQFSRFPIVEVVSSTGARQNIQKLDSIFSVFGFPTEVTTDNGSPFNSDEFYKYVKEKNIRHRRIIPRWPQANGLVERFNRTLNKTLQMSFTNRWDWKRQLNQMLVDYRNTPQSSTKCSPSDLIFGYSLKILIPDEKHVRHSLDLQSIQDRDNQVKMKSKERHDNKKFFSDLQIGDNVLIRNEQKTKTSSFYNQEPYVIINVKGPMITAKNKENKQVTRHRSYFKIISSVNKNLVNPYRSESEMSEDDSLVENHVPERYVSENRKTSADGHTLLDINSKASTSGIQDSVIQENMTDIQVPRTQNSDETFHPYNLRRNIKPPNRLIVEK